MKGRLQNFLKAIEEESPDVVCLQELFTIKLFGLFSWTSEYDFVVSGLEGLGYCLCRPSDGVSSLPIFFGQNSGLAVFVKAQIGLECVECKEVVFQKSAELVCNKGYQLVTLSLTDDSGSKSGRNLHVINTHLDARPQVIVSQYREVVLAVASINNRSKVLTELKKTSDERTEEDVGNSKKNEEMEETTNNHFVVTGDWNICQQKVWDDGSLYQALSKEFQELGLVDMFSDEDCITFDQDGACYDHLFSDLPVLSYQVLPHRDEVISDHCAISVELSVPFL